MSGVTAVPAAARALLRAGLRRRSSSRRGSRDGGHRCVPRRRQRARRVPRSATIDSTSTSRPTPGPTRSRRLVTGWADAVWLQGKRFGTVGCEKDGERFEITTFRAEVYRPESRKPEVTFSRRHRDRPLAARLHGERDGDRARPSPSSSIPFGGLADLAARRLRTPLAPEISFGDDPLRMLRAARFVADARLRARRRAGRGDRARCASGCEIISAERIRDELSKLLVADDPSPGLWLIARTGLSDEFLPELNAMQLEQDPIHRHKDVLAHTIAVVAKTSPDAEAAARRAAARRRQAAARAASDRSGVTFHHHEVVGARMAQRAAARAALPERDRRRRDPARRAAPAVPHVPRWAGPTARCAATCATPGRCSTT